MDNLKQNTDELLNDEKVEISTPRSADFSGETPHYPMDGNSNCTAWCSWYTSRVFRNGQAGWDCRFVIKATKTNPYATYGQGSVQAGMDGREENGTLEKKYIEIVANQVRTYYDQTVFVKAEAGADITLSAYANILVPNVVSKGMKFSISVKRNLWGVYFDANGGSGAPSMMKRHWGEIVYIPATLPTRYGYTFKGWSKTRDSSVVNYNPGDPIGDDFDVTLYAVWGQNTIKTWSITYNANGGTGAPARQTANVGQSITITSSRPTRSGYTFLGWATWSSATYAEYQPGSRLQSDYDMTLYAVWQQNQSTQYSLSFNLQGGTGTFNTLYGSYGDRVQIPYKSPTKSGYIFLGWATYSGGSASYQPGEYYTLYGNATLYAVWQKEQSTQYCTITFNANGGTGAPASQQKTVGEATYIPYTKPIRSGYAFLGWSTSQYTSSAQYQPGQAYTPYGDMTFYAVWRQNVVKVTITYIGDSGETNIPSSQTVDKNSWNTISNQIPVKPGYKFKGWSSHSFNGTVDYMPGEMYIINSNLTLYTVFEKVLDNGDGTYTISYDGNGSNVTGVPTPTRYTIYEGGGFLIPYEEPKRPGYRFLGWSRTSTGAVDFSSGTWVEQQINMTLYAVWEEENTDPPSIFLPDTYSINLDFNYVPSINIRAEITNPQNRTVYYKVCFVDNSNGDINDYFVNSNGNTGTISASTMNVQMVAASEIVKRSIQNCNSEFEFKLAICVSYDNTFSNSSLTMKKYITTISINNYRKPVIKDLTVERTAEGGAQLDAVFKYADSFTKVNTNYTGATVYINGSSALSSTFTNENILTNGINTINSIFTFVDSVVSDGNQTFKLEISDGIFTVEQTVTLSVLQSDGDVYIYPNGLIEASGFVRLSSSDENIILFKRGGFVYAKNFKKIASGVYFCPDVIELFGRGVTTAIHVSDEFGNILTDENYNIIY